MVVRALANLKGKAYIQQKKKKKRMLEYGNNKRVQFRFGWCKYSQFFFFFVNEKCWKQHGGIFWSMADHHFIYSLNTTRASFSPFLLEHVFKSGY